MLPVKEASRKLGVSASTLYQLASRRAIAHYKVGGKILFKPEDLDVYLESCRVGVASAAPAPRARVALKHLTAR